MQTPFSISDLPAVPELEKAVIGAVLLEPDTLTEVASILTPECFHDTVLAEIYRVITSMDASNIPVDLMTVHQQCQIPQLKGAKISHVLVECTQMVGSGVHAAAHARIIRDRFTARQLITTGVTLAAKAGDPDADVADTLDYLSGQLDAISGQNIGGGARLIGDIAPESLRAAENRHKLYQSRRIAGVDTGLSDLNLMTGGWKGSQLVILAARPAMGKTALMLHFAKAAAKAGVPVCLFSLEMSGLSLTDRLLLSECGVEADRFRSGNLTPDDWRMLEAAGDALTSLPIYVDDKPVVSMRYIRARSKIMQKRGRCGVVMVDYLQLADTATDRKNRNREQEIAQATREAKIIAKELNVPFLLLSQLSRGVEGRTDKMPLLSDLRESGAIEQDADIVAFIYRPAYYGIKEIQTTSRGTISTDGLGMLSIRKQRDGATGDIPFRHNPAMTKITDYTAADLNPQEPF